MFSQILPSVRLNQIIANGWKRRSVNTSPQFVTTCRQELTIQRHRGKIKGKKTNVPCLKLNLIITMPYILLNRLYTT